MLDLIKVTDNGVDAKDLHDFLEIKHRYRDWIRNNIRDYGFKEGKDFSYFYSESNGGRPSKECAISVTMAKELSMVSKTDKGKKARLYFIKCEEIAKEAYANSKAIRLLGKEVRKSLTDAVQESGEQERMHGHGYSTYTNMIYRMLGISEMHKQFKIAYPKGDFRSTLDSGILEKVKLAEALIKPLLELDKQYSEIRDTLKPLFERKEIEG